MLYRETALNPSAQHLCACHWILLPDQVSVGANDDDREKPVARLRPLTAQAPKRRTHSQATPGPCSSDSPLYTGVCQPMTGPFQRTFWDTNLTDGLRQGAPIRFGDRYAPTEARGGNGSWAV